MLFEDPGEVVAVAETAFLGNRLYTLAGMAQHDTGTVEPETQAVLLGRYAGVSFEKADEAVDAHAGGRRRIFVPDARLPVSSYKLHRVLHPPVRSLVDRHSLWDMQAVSGIETYGDQIKAASRTDGKGICLYLPKALSYTFNKNLSDLTFFGYKLDKRAACAVDAHAEGEKAHFSMPRCAGDLLYVGVK